MRRPAGLPAQPTALLHRAAELEALTQALADGTRLLTLTGPGGVGKTRLAIELAHNIESTFPDGVVFVDLSLCDTPDAALAAIARTMDVEGTARVSLLYSLCRSLSRRRLLLLLDGFEHAVGAAPSIAELLVHCPGLVMLLTSQVPLRLRWERVQPVAPLVPPDPNCSTLEELSANPCVQLFAQRARAILPEFTLTDANAGAVAEICSRLEGLPLAIELMAARINVLTPSTMAARLEEQFTLLRHPAPDVPDRQHSLAATLDWSFELLSEAERTLLSRMAPFAGGFDLDMATAMAGPETAEIGVLQRLASLVDKSFLVPDLNHTKEPRFRFLETVRAYVEERARQCGELDSARERHFLYFLELARQAWRAADTERQGSWFARLSREMANLSEAFRWAAGRTSEADLHLAVALIPFWQARVHIREGIQRLIEALGRHADAEATLRFEALDGLANMMRWEGRFGAAQEALSEAMALAHSADRDDLLDRALLNEGMLLAVQGEIEAARLLLVEVRARWQARDDRRGLALTIQYLGIVELEAGAYGPARTMLEESLSIFEQLRDSRSVAGSLAALARLARLDGDTTRAAILLARALELCAEIGCRRSMCVIVEQSAGLVAASEDPDTVARLLGAADAQRNTGGFVRNAYEEWAYDDARVQLVERAGEDHIQSCLTAGGRLSLEQAADTARALLAHAASPTARLQDAGVDRGKLSRREYEVLQLVAQGLSNKQIAHVLTISENTVKYHVTSLLNKLGADTRAQTVAMAAQLNLLRRVS
jgi:non-specific serine/threonine protein kinase